MENASPLKEADLNFWSPPNGAALAGRTARNPVARLGGGLLKAGPRVRIRLPPAVSSANSRSRCSAHCSLSNLLTSVKPVKMGLDAVGEGKRYVTRHDDLLPEDAEMDSNFLRSAANIWLTSV